MPSNPVTAEPLATGPVQLILARSGTLAAGPRAGTDLRG
jgi:hypothetical protein